MLLVGQTKSKSIIPYQHSDPEGCPDALLTAATLLASVADQRIQLYMLPHGYMASF